jgi:hypothetical protein
MVIKSYKIFERGDGVEDENDNLPSTGPKFNVGDEVTAKIDYGRQRAKVISVNKDTKTYTVKTSDYKIYSNRKEADLKFYNKQLEIDFKSKPVNPTPGSNPPDYILGIPSGEVVLFDNINDLKMMIDRKLATWTHDFRGQVLNCYCTPDKNIERIKSILSTLKNGKSDESEYHKICQEYIDEMRIATDRKYVVAYKKNTIGGAYYFIIVPDFDEHWKKYYKNVFLDMTQASQNMSKKYRKSTFLFGAKITEFDQKDIKYYG